MSMFFRTSHHQEAGSSSSFELPQPCRQLTFSEIQLATQNFDESLVIGRGGFGKVYKGTITYGDNRLTVAIKRLDSTSSQGASEFWSEVKMLSKLRHCHLVSLIGYCNDGQEMILVYEYMTRGTLEDRLHKGRIPLMWVLRLKICIGAARGLDYLHTGTGIKHGVIHRDVKSSNILLDDSWAAKISDFGLSKIGPTNQPCTFVSTQVKGTFGYLDPDYYQTGRLTRKSDVYAFGVVLFEVLCGKRAVDRSIDEDQWGLACWAHDSIKEGRLKQIVDPDMMRQRISPKCLKDFSRLADQCLHNHPKHRPTMAEVVVGLEFVLALQEKENTKFKPKVPMFVLPSNGENSDGVTSLKSLELYLYNILGENQIYHRFDFDSINVATDNLSEANKVSHEYKYTTYKGKLKNGKSIAVAKFYGSTPRDIKDYMHEALISSKLEHENLVNLFGYCIEGTKMFLVYELAFHSRLDLLIFDPMCTLLDWNKRYKIILGVSRALVYLHKHAPIRIIHSNLHPGNILLDENLDPKLSDFRYATTINETDCIVVDEFPWPMGSLAPEYMNGHLSTKVDVFNFGMLVLEILTGRRACEYSILKADKDLVEYVSRNWLEGTSSNVIDSRIDADSSLMKIFIEIGLLCVQRDASDRPTMEEVVDMLLANSSLTLRVSKMRENMTIKGSYSPYIEKPVNDFDTSAIDDYDTSAVEEYISDLCPR